MNFDEFEQNKGKAAPPKDCCTSLVHVKRTAEEFFKMDPDAHLGGVEREVHDISTPDPWDPDANRDHFGFFRPDLGVGSIGCYGRFR